MKAVGLEAALVVLSVIFSGGGCCCCCVGVQQNMKLDMSPAQAPWSFLYQRFGGLGGWCWMLMAVERWTITYSGCFFCSPFSLDHAHEGKVFSFFFFTSLTCHTSLLSYRWLNQCLLSPYLDLLVMPSTPRSVGPQREIRQIQAETRRSKTHHDSSVLPNPFLLIPMFSFHCSTTLLPVE